MTGFRKSGDRPGLRTRKQLLYLRAAACVLTALLALQALVPAAGWTVRAEAAQKTEESGQEDGADAVDLSGAPGQDEDEDAALSGSASEQTGTDSLLNLGADKQRHRIDQLMADMTLREKVGQMIHVSFRGWRDDPSGQITSFEEMNDEVRDFLSERRLGGVLLYGENCGESRKTLTLVNDMQKANAETDSKVKIPLLVSADEEGGIVSRLGQGVGWPGNMAVAATGDPEYARQEGLEIGKQLAAVSINTAFGPVMDVNDNPENPVIGVRAFSDDLLTVASCGTAFMQGMSQSGTIPVLKHFPGHGNTDSDSHTGLPRVEKTLDQLNEKELVPFRLGIEAGAEMIMTAHIEYPGLDQETYRSKATGEEVYLPATMSHTILTDILRDKMGFEGVVITDALEMASLTEHFAEDDVYRMSINAGADILLSPHTVFDRDSLQRLGASIDRIVEMAEKGEIKQERIDESVRRILTLKARYGLLDTDQAVLTQDQLDKALPADEEIQKAREKAWNMTQKGITLVKNENEALPCAVKKGQRILILYPGQSRVETAAFAKKRLEEEKAIPEGTEWETLVYDRAAEAQCLEAARRADCVIAVTTLFEASELDPGTEEGESGAVLDRIIDAVHKDGKKITVISAELPYDAARYQSADAILLTYGSTWMLETPDENTSFSPNLPAAICAVFGEFTPEGKLPVDLPALTDEYLYSGEILYPRGFSAADSGRKTEDKAKEAGAEADSEKEPIKENDSTKDNNSVKETDSTEENKSAKETDSTKENKSVKENDSAAEKKAGTDQAENKKEKED